MKIIEIVVQPDGQTHVETKGFTGGECRDASKFIENALGERTGERLTGEFYAEQQQREQLREGG